MADQNEPQPHHYLVVWSAVKLDRSVESDVDYVDGFSALEASGVVLERLSDLGFISARIVLVSELVHAIEWTDDEIDDAVRHFELQRAAVEDAEREREIEQQQIEQALIERLKDTKTKTKRGKA